MAEILHLGPRGFAIFCDDIREEASGKTTYVGSYSDAMYVHGELPQTLPLFCCVFHLYCGREELFEKLTLQVSMPWDEEGKPTVSANVNRDDVPVLPVEGAEDDPVFGGYHIGAKLSLRSFAVHSFGRIRASAIWDDHIIPIGSLILSSVPERLKNREESKTE